MRAHLKIYGGAHLAQKVIDVTVMLRHALYELIEVVHKASDLIMTALRTRGM